MEVKIMTPAGVLHEAREHAPGSKLAVVDGVPCPACGNAPLMAAGEVPHVVRSTSHEHCTEWDARATCCGAAGFTIGARVTSLFGFEEDRAVLNGRPRVY